MVKLIIKMQKQLQLFLGIFISLSMLFSVNIQAQSVQNPQSGPAGLTGKVPTEPPTQAATITFPTNGTTFTDSQIDVIGVCPQGLLVKLFKNEVFAGSAQCDSGSFTITVDLFSGDNELIARVFDELDQEGPESNKPVVRFDDAAGVDSALDRVTLTTNFAKRGANPGSTLRWPITITGGTGPYALSVGWGDGSEDLYTIETAGEFNIEHIYDTPGTYRIVIKVTDSNGTTSFLQLVGVANGAIQDDGTGGSSVTGLTGNDDGSASIQSAASPGFRFVVWPLYVMIFLIISTFWLGRRYEIKKLKRKLASQQTLG